jgi:hypothetical protein
VWRRTKNLPVELFGSNLQESVRPLHEVLQKIAGGGVERPINVTTKQDRPALMKLMILVTVTFCGLISGQPDAFAEENFQKLSGTQIRAKFTGMQFTDQVHWGQVFGPNGTLTSEEMGRKRVGTWRVVKDQLCTDLGKEGGNDWFDVWTSGKKAQLKIPGSTELPFEGVLEIPPIRR